MPVFHARRSCRALPPATSPRAIRRVRGRRGLPVGRQLVARPRRDVGHSVQQSPEDASVGATGSLLQVVDEGVRFRPRLVHRRVSHADAFLADRCTSTEPAEPVVMSVAQRLRFGQRPRTRAPATVVMSVAQQLREVRSTSKDDIESRQQQLELGPWKPAGTFIEQASVESDDLRGVGHRISRKTRRPCGQKHVARRVGPPQVARERHAHRGGEAASIQGVALHHHDRSSKPWARSDGGGKIGPPDLALRDHHSTRSRTRRAAAARNSSGSAPT